MTTVRDVPPSVIVTMAGLGSRFRAAGYTVPKYRVEVHGRTLFAWSMESLRRFWDRGASAVFVALADDSAGPFIAGQAAELGIGDHRLIELAELTDGQATSALLGLDGVDDAAPLVVYNIDTFVEPQTLDPGDLRDDGWIPCFPGAGDAWSFVRAEDDGRVLEVREKVRISPHATVGLYAFGSAGLYRATYEEFYADPANVERGERYIAPMYTHMVRAGRRLWMSGVPANAVHPLGTPGEVESFASAPPPVPAPGTR